MVKPGKPIRSLLASPCSLSTPCAKHAEVDKTRALLLRGSQSREGSSPGETGEERLRTLSEKAADSKTSDLTCSWKTMTPHLLHRLGSPGALLELNISEHSISGSVDMQLGPGIAHLTMIPSESMELVHRPGECNWHRATAFTLQVEQRGRKGT